MTKKIFFNTPINIEKMHTIWRELIANPPRGYEYILPKKTPIYERFSSLRKYSSLYWIYKTFVKSFITPVELSEKFVKIPPEIDLVYSPERLIHQSVPWVCDTEEAICFAGNDYNLLKKKRNRSTSLKSLLQKNNIFYKIWKKES